MGVCERKRESDTNEWVNGIDSEQNIMNNFFLFSIFPFQRLVSASFAAGPDANAPRQRHAPLYGRIVPEEHLPATHRDAVHQVSTFHSINP